MHHMEIFATLTLALAVLAALVLLVRGIVRSRQMNQALEAKSRLQQQVLSQFSESDELAHFLNTPAGEEFVSAAEMPIDNNPYTSILRSIRGGILAIAVGVTLYFLNNEVGGEGFRWLGILLSVGGLAVIGGAGVSYFLSQKWGLLPTSTEASRG